MPVSDYGDTQGGKPEAPAEALRPARQDRHGRMPRSRASKTACERLLTASLR